MYYESLKNRVRAVKTVRDRQRAGLAVLDTLDVTAHIAPIYIPFHADIENGSHTVYNLPGGRGSCKSSFVSLEIVYGIMKDPTGNSSAIVFRLPPGIRCHCRKRLLRHNREAPSPAPQNGPKNDVLHHLGEYHARPFPHGFECVLSFPERYPAQHRKGGYSILLLSLLFALPCPIRIVKLTKPFSGAVCVFIRWHGLSPFRGL